ncbi:NAD(P)H-dependent glycerol-3-phosphate dehydrogenase [Mesobacterium sp. TK19101]|uniref:Glycerol-3-phosphate dehydrogenase [NAD(P)+] n=1 Tax=Mesobacterium hydrothermale TaxID=3111907 RepID=A0ABU6HGK1_9RHOB|nr:NAD(P)H-dependent glycerol-3-phosphate dehydrogenase [Mesobacterium sp. TK19101]MEC3861584.1 NAD(P)H-dependent glycerol-3-phosphate dehydrogenase [Mesobacterium sp. TK19101]
MSIAILGAGAFGTALAVALGQDRPVTLWGRDVQALRVTRQTPRLPGVFLPDGVTVTADLERALDAAALLLSMPMQSLMGFAETIRRPLTGKALVACCKGIDLTTLQGPSAILGARWPEATPAILTGPSFAADIARGLPTALTLACADDVLGQRLQRELSTQTLRLYRSTDVIGAELGGALKNVIAIACGVTIGAGLGDSARAALMTRGFAEMARYARHRGADPATLAGLSGLGDLALTCTSDLSRNYRFGLSIGRKEGFDSSVTVEGAATARALAAIASDHGLSLPITQAVAALVESRATVDAVLHDLLSRPLKEETR